MKRIESVDEYKQLIKRVRSIGKLVLNNNFLLPDRISNLIQSKQLFHIEDDSSLYLFINQNMFYELLVLSADINSIQVPTAALPVQFNYTMRENSGLMDILKSVLSSNGFDHLATNFEMARSKEMPPQTTKQVDNLQLEHIQLEEIDRLITIWHKTLNDTINPIPKYDDLLNNADHYYAIRYRRDLIGGLSTAQTTARVLIEHLAIDPKYQGHGFGKNAMQLLIKKHTDKDLYLWVNSENSNAIRLYERLSFAKTGKESIQFVRN